MTTQEKIDYLKADLLKAKGAEQVSVSTKPGGFDLRGQFTTATTEAVMAAAADLPPQPPRTSPK